MTSLAIVSMAINLISSVIVLEKEHILGMWYDSKNFEFSENRNFLEGVNPVASLD